MRQLVIVMTTSVRWWRCYTWCNRFWLQIPTGRGRGRPPLSAEVCCLKMLLSFRPTTLLPRVGYCECRNDGLLCLFTLSGLCMPSMSQAQDREFTLGCGESGFTHVQPCFDHWLSVHCMDGTFQAAAVFQDSESFRKQYNLALSCILSVNFDLSGFKLLTWSHPWHWNILHSIQTYWHYWMQFSIPFCEKTASAKLQTVNNIIWSDCKSKGHFPSV